MAKKRATPNEQEAARAAASKPEPLPCCEGPCCQDAKAALEAAKTLPDILAVIYGLAPAKRAELHEAIAEARSRIQGSV